MRTNLNKINNDLNDRLKEVNVSLVDFIYKNNKSKIGLKCNVDGHEWQTTYYCFVKVKNGCPRCAGQVVYKHEATENVNKRLKEINASLRENFQYVGSKTRLKLKCNNDGYEWETSYSNFVNSKTGCYKCSKRVLYDIEIKNNINNRLKEMNASLIDEYNHKNNKSILKLKCNIDGHTWGSTYINFINNKRGCAVCARVLKLNQKESEMRVDKQCKKMSCRLSETFTYNKTNNTTLKLICDDCNKEWVVGYNNFMSKGSGCPFCKESKGEKEISRLLEEKNIKYEKQKKFKGCKNINNLFFDFYVPDKNTCIEFDGIQHFEKLRFFGGDDGLKKIIHRDNIKNEYCSSNNIKLIRIPYYEFDKIDKILEHNLYKKLF